jgi:hypothetical protein
MSMSLKISIAIAILAEIYRLWRNHRATAPARRRA